MRKSLEIAPHWRQVALRWSDLESQKAVAENVVVRNPFRAETADYEQSLSMHPFIAGI